MRDDVVTPAAARRLASAGLRWDPTPGDWCAVFGAAHVGEHPSSLWIVVNQHTGDTITIADSAGQWPLSRVAAADCLWLPTAGQLKTWLRAQGYRVATGETSAPLLGGLQHTRFVCRLTRAGVPDREDFEGSSEAEAVAVAVIRVLGDHSPGESSSNW